MIIQLSQDILFVKDRLQLHQSIFNKDKTIGMSTQNQSKPFTGNFELETKIRVIIQQVLSATIRKLSIFNEKIDKFEDYFMVYKEKIQTLEKSCNENKQTIAVENDQRMKLKKEITNNSIKAEQLQQKNNIRFDQINNEVAELAKTIKQVQRQNQNLNTQLSKTKGKFLEYSNTISSLKQEVSWKITKYIEQTAQTNTQIKINNEKMKKQYFNIQLMIEKQKEKYEKIIELNENHENDTKRIFEDIQRLEGQNKIRFQENKKTLEKMDDYDTILQSKLKALDNKCELRISQLQKDNKKSMNAVKKIQTFNQMIEGIKQEQQKNVKQILKKIQQTNKRIKEDSQAQNLKLSKQILRIEKTLQKKLSDLKQTTQRAEDFLSQKIEFIKLEIQSQISSKTTQLMQMQEKKQDNNKVNSSTMQQVATKISKLNMEIRKQIVRIDSSIKEVKFDAKKDLQNFMQTVDKKIQSIEIKQVVVSKFQQPLLPPQQVVSPELLKQVQDLNTILQTKIIDISKRLDKKDEQIVEIKENESKRQIFQKEMVQKIDVYFKQQEEEMTNKVQKIMFLVTKMRGDGIVRSQFVEKEIKDIKRNHAEYRQYTDTLLKLSPAFGECINLILALIYDAEYQHSKIIQDGLPLLKKDEERFNTCLEGILYEFKEKKKPGVICYRHKDLKKTDIVKATFNAYIKTWEELFQNQFKNKTQFLPKSFYKKLIEKAMDPKAPQEKVERKEITSLSPRRQNNFYEKVTSSIGFHKPSEANPQRKNETERGQLNSNTNLSIPLTQVPSKQATKVLKNIEQEQKIREMKETIVSKGSKESAQGENIMNSSFHIRKKKTVKKEEVIVVNVATQRA